ncbi:MAG: HEPN domain-containing protein [Spirochaetes bacterium]|nr:HEPN domain-containing protein [Spirochaetota bacterium]
MADPGLKGQIAAMMDKAARSLEASKLLLDGRNDEFSSSRSYYSAFYAIQALLLTRNLVYSKHAGVISGFNEHFIRSNIFPRDFSKHISRLFRERHIGDYDFERIITKNDAHEDHRIASDIVKAIREYLIHEGFMS